MTPNTDSFLFRTVMGIVLFVIIGCILFFGGRDLLLLTGSQRTVPALIATGAPFPCPTPPSNRSCHNLTYGYTVNGQHFLFDRTFEIGRQPRIEISYVTWAPAIYKVYEMP